MKPFLAMTSRNALPCLLRSSRNMCRGRYFCHCTATLPFHLPAAAALSWPLNDLLCTCQNWDFGFCLNWTLHSFQLLLLKDSLSSDDFRVEGCVLRALDDAGYGQGSRNFGIDFALRHLRVFVER